jgi:hypothetical protein
MSTKPTINPQILDVSSLNAISLHLSERADSIHQFSLQDLIYDLRVASKVCDKLSSLRFRIGEIAEAALTQDPGATARDLRELLEPCEQEG